MEEKKIWATLQRIKELFTQKISKVWDPGSATLHFRKRLS
jgi:hypothetical protein